MLGDRRQRSPVGWETCDHRGGVAEPALGETDNPLLGDVLVSNRMSVRSGPASMQACLDRDDIRCDRADRQRGPDPRENVRAPHAPVQEQHLDELSRARSVAVHFPRLLPERLMRRGEKNYESSPGDPGGEEDPHCVERASG